MTTRSPFSNSYGTSGNVEAAKSPEYSDTTLRDSESVIADIKSQSRVTLVAGIAIGLSILVSLILAIVVTAQKPEAQGLYMLYILGLVLTCIAEILLIQFSMRQHLPPSSTWALWVIGIALFAESILSDIFMFQ